MLAAPLLVGRAFCGYLCPTGALIEWPSPSPGSVRGSRPARERRCAGRRSSCCSAVGGLALFASGAYLFFDPLATLTRSATVLLYPLVDRLLRLLGDVPTSRRRRASPPTTSRTSRRAASSSARPLVYGLQLFVLGWRSRWWACPGSSRACGAATFARSARCSACQAGSRCSAASSTPRSASLREVREGVPARRRPRRLPRHRHLALPARARVRRRLPDRRDLVRAAPGTLGVPPSRRARSRGRAVALAAGFFAFTGLARAKRDPRLIRPPGRTAPKASCSRCAAGAGSA